MSKPLVGLLLGAVLGAFDGLTALLYPDTQSMIVGIVIGSTIKGLITGLVAGVVARKLRSLPLGILVGLLVGFGLSSLVGAFPAENGKNYYWEIVIPGSIVGAIVGFATQRLGRAPASTAQSSRAA